jgi:hypothetical protein
MDHDIMTETYEPIDVGTSGFKRLECKSLSDTHLGLQIVLGDVASERSIELTFEGFVGYRNINESFRLRTWQKRTPYSTSGVFLVGNSLWLEWLRAESGGVLDGVILRHYSIYTGEDCIDVASEFPPTFTSARLDS